MDDKESEKFNITNISNYMKIYTKWKITIKIERLDNCIIITKFNINNVLVSSLEICDNMNQVDIGKELVNLLYLNV